MKYHLSMRAFVWLMFLGSATQPAYSCTYKDVQNFTIKECVAVGATSIPVEVALGVPVIAATWTIGKITLFGPNASDFAIVSDKCSNRTLPTTQSCLITFTITPSQPGHRIAYWTAPIGPSPYYVGTTFLVDGYGVGCVPQVGKKPKENVVPVGSCGLNPLTWGSKWSKDFTDGSKLELNCEVPPGKSYDVPAYVYWYTSPEGSRNRVGECIFSGGCNDIRYYTPGLLDANGRDACVITTYFQNVDGWTNDGERKTVDGTVFTTADEPYLDVLKWSFDANKSKLTWVDEKYEYRGNPLLATNCASFEPYIGNFVRTAWRVDPIVGPQTENWFDELASQLQVEPPRDMEAFLACDVNLDGKCNSVDVAAFQANLGKCRSDLGYTLASDRLDFDRDGCITSNDLESFKSNYLPILLKQMWVPLDFTGVGRSGELLYDPTIGTGYTALSNGDGTYQYVPNLFTPSFNTLRTGDYNSDGKADLVVYNSHTALAYIGMSNGDGTFAFQSLFWSAGYNFVETGDLNGDGKTDFALYNSSTGTMYTGISNGAGGFTYKYTLISIGYTYIRLADFTGDGKADLFAYSAATGLTSVGIGDGAGGFTFHSFQISPNYNLIETGDLNADGEADLLLYNGTNGNAATGISDGAGGFAFTSMPFTPGFTSIRLGDFTGDGKADIVVYNKNNAAAYFGTGTGTGTFNFQSLFWSPGYDWIVPQDVNGDGKIDVVLYNSATGTEYTGISNGNGTFAYTYQYWGIGKTLAK